jgi:hypothetical protein
MARTKNGQKTEKNGQTVNIVVKGIGRTRPRERRPGRKQSPASIATRFKPGNTFAKNRRPLPKFADAYTTALMDEVPAALRKQLGVKKGTTMMDLLVQRVVEEAAVNASIPHVTELRDTTQGKNPDRRITMTANIERLIQDPEFLKFVEQCADRYLSQERGAIHGSASVRELGDEVSSTEGFDLES